MIIWPTTGATGINVLTALRDVEIDAGNIYSHGTDAGAVVTSYLSWVSAATNRLRGLVNPEDQRRLILSETYWSALSMANPSAAPPLMRAIHDEIAARQHAIKLAAQALSDFLTTWTQDALGTTFLVVDTNVILHHGQDVEHIPWHRLVGEGTQVPLCVVLPLLIVDELDDQKRGKQRSEARRALRSIYAHFRSDVAIPVTLTSPTLGSAPVQMRLLLDDSGHIRLPRADDELVARAVSLQSLLGKQIRFITYDTGAALRATAAGLSTHHLQENLEEEEAARPPRGNNAPPAAP